MNRHFKYLFVFMFLFITMNFVSAELTDGLLGYWKFDENTDLTVVDATGINNGTITNLTWTTGKINSGLLWDNNTISRYINIPSNDIYNKGNNFSISLWYYNTQTPVHTSITYPLFQKALSSHAAPYYEIHLGFEYDTKQRLVLSVARNNLPQNIAYISDTNSIPVNSWTHIAITYNNGTVKYYINGIDSNTQTMPGSGNLNYYSTPISIGRYTNVDNLIYRLVGKEDEIGYWNKALSQSEITQLYNSGNGISYPFISTNSTIINPQPILYTNNSYNFLGTFKDLDYNSEATYKYSFGYNNTNSFDGSETYIDTNQTLDYAQTEFKDFNLSKTFNNTDVAEDLYSFFIVHRYYNSDYNESFTGWSSTTFDIVQAEIILNIYDENTLLPISTVRITDSNGTTYDTNATGYISLGQLSGDKSFTISKTGYDSRKLDFFFKVSDYYDWNFALTQDGNSESIGFIVKDSNDNLWTNKYILFSNDGNIIGSYKTSATGTATASLLANGDYNALLYTADGNLTDTYEKTTVTVNKPKNEKTSALISPFNIYVSGQLQYDLTNQTASSVSFNVFAGTTDFYTFTAVDYNAVVADQKYIPKSYLVQVPMGNSYVNAITYQPYLLLKTDGIVPKVVILDQLNRTIENAQIYVSKYVGGILTVVESGYTFSNGAFNFSAYPLDVYYLTVYYNGTDYGTFSVQPRESSDIFYIKIDRTTAEDIAQALIIQTNLDDTSRYQNRDTNINVLGTITSNFNYITDYNVNVYERGNLVYSSNTVATGLSININKLVDVNLIPDNVHSAVIKIIVNYSIAGVTGSQTFSKNIMITDSPDVIGTIEDAQTEIGQPLSIFIALAVAIMLIAVLIFSGILTDPAILAVFGALVIGVFMMLGFLDIGVVVLGMDIGRFAYFLGLMATLYFALFGGR
jgi:hypothetical protein